MCAGKETRAGWSASAVVVEKGEYKMLFPLFYQLAEYFKWSLACRRTPCDDDHCRKIRFASNVLRVSGVRVVLLIATSQKKVWKKQFWTSGVTTLYISTYYSIQGPNLLFSFQNFVCTEAKLAAEIEANFFFSMKLEGRLRQHRLSIHKKI